MNSVDPEKEWVKVKYYDFSDKDENRLPKIPKSHFRTNTPDFHENYFPRCTKRCLK